MATKLALDSTLIEEARQLGEQRTKEDVRRRKQLKLIEMFGTVDLDETLDIKAQRGVQRAPHVPSADL